MKIGMINTLYHPYQVGGAERSARLLAEALVAAGHDVFVITCAEQRGCEVLNGVRIYREPLANVYWPFAPGARVQLLKPLWHLIDTLNPVMASHVKRILRVEQPDVVNTNNIGGFSVSVWPVIKVLDIPLVHTVRDYYLMCVRSTLYRQAENRNCEQLCLTCKTLSAPRRRHAAYVDRVIGISRAALDEHAALGLFAEIPCAVIPNIASPDQARINPGKKPPYTRFGYLGRIEPSKGLTELLTAFSAALKSRPDLRLTLGGIGEQDYVQQLRASFPQTAITFLGQVEPADFFDSIDFLVVPSRWKEPLGRVVLEAYHYGVPVLGARRGGIAENIVEGETGFRFDVSAPDELASLMARCADCNDSDYAKFGVAIARQREKYSASTIVRDYLAELELTRLATRNTPCRA